MALTLHVALTAPSAAPAMTEDVIAVPILPTASAGRACVGSRGALIFSPPPLLSDWPAWLPKPSKCLSVEMVREKADCLVTRDKLPFSFVGEVRAVQWTLKTRTIQDVDASMFVGEVRVSIQEFV